MDTKGILVCLAKKINRIEDKDADYRNNPTWKTLREEQKQCYVKLAEEELEFYQKEYQVRPTEENKNKINFYIDYIEKEKPKVKEKEN